MNHDEWSLLIHPNSGRKYFYNIKSGESRWNLQAIGGPYSSYDTDPLLTNNLTHRHNANARQRYHSLNQDGFDEKAVKYNRPGKLSFMTPPRERPGQHAPNSQQQSLSAVAKHRKTHTIKSPNNFIARDDALDRKYTIGQTQQGSGLRTLLPLSVGDVINVTQSSDTKSRPMLDNYNKDYIALSKEYHLMERFRVNPYSSSPDLEYTPTCVMCKRGGKRLKVLFPCEHVCVCGSCLESSLSKRCPVCNEIIRVVFDHDGNAHENYMRWAEEVKPSISTKFLQQFFAESKDTIKREVMKRPPRSIDNFDLLADKEEHETSPHRRRSSGIFSCWWWLVGRRASSARPNRPQW